MQTLNDICKVITCGVAKRPEYVEKGIPFLSSKNVKENRFILKHYNYVSEEDFQQLTKHNKPENGDILYTRVGSYGEAAIVDLDFEFAIFVSLTLIKPNPKLVFNRYLMHYLNSPKIRFLAENSTSGIGVKNLNVGAVRDFPINLPSLKTQQKIAAILDEADRLRQLDKKLIQKYEDLSQSLFLEMFGDPLTNPNGWKTMNANSYSKKVTVGVVVRPSSYYAEEGVPALRGQNIKENIIDLENLVYFNEEDHYSKLSKSILRHNDLVIVRTGKTGTAAVVPEELDGINCIDLVILRPNIKVINPYFLAHFYNSKRGKSIVLTHNRGQIQQHFNIGSVKKVEIPVPPIELQEEFANRLVVIKKQKIQAQGSKDLNNKLFNCLLQKAFKGELV